MFKKDKDKEIIVPVKLDLNSPITFSCERDLACFTKCCRDVQVCLTPVDVINLKKRLNLSSQEFLAIYTLPGEIPGIELPIPVLKPLKEGSRECPFIGDDGCMIFDARPLNCRYYPLAFGIFHNFDESKNESFFALVKEPICLGHGLGQEVTVKDYLASQQVFEIEKDNQPWIEIILRRKSLGPLVNIPDKTLQMFFLASYNVDSFRNFVFESKFLSIFDIEEERLRLVREDDIECLKLGMDWLKTVLFGDKILRMHERKTTII